MLLRGLSSNEHFSRYLCLWRLNGDNHNGDNKVQGVKLSYKSYKMLYFWNCPIKSYIFSKCPMNPYFQQKQQFLSIVLSISRVWVM